MRSGFGLVEFRGQPYELDEGHDDSQGAKNEGQHRLGPRQSIEPETEGEKASHGSGECCSYAEIGCGLTENPREIARRSVSLGNRCPLSPQD